MPQQYRRGSQNKAKDRRSARKRAYYERYRREYELKKIRRRANREKRITAAKFRRANI